MQKAWSILFLLTLSISLKAEVICGTVRVENHGPLTCVEPTYTIEVATGLSTDTTITYQLSDNNTPILKSLVPGAYYCVRGDFRPTNGDMKIFEVQQIL
jgi:hypothetical protein